MGDVGTFQALALQVVLAERSLREMQGQVRLHFRTQDPQGLASGYQAEAADG